MSYDLLFLPNEMIDFETGQDRADILDSRVKSGASMNSQPILLETVRKVFNTIAEGPADEHVYDGRVSLGSGPAQLDLSASLSDSHPEHLESLSLHGFNWLSPLQNRLINQLCRHFHLLGYDAQVNTVWLPLGNDSIVLAASKNPRLRDLAMPVVFPRDQERFPKSTLSALDLPHPEKLSAESWFIHWPGDDVASQRLHDATS